MASKSQISWAKIARRIRVPIGFIFTALYLWLARPTWKSLLFGIALVIVGVTVRALASGHVRKNEKLTTSGPYAYTRNPLYLGSLILAVGFAVAALNWWIAIAIVVIFLAIYLPVIRSEEVFLRTRFPEFSEYSRRVPILIPRFTPPNRSEEVFSWELYRKHREYNAAIGSAALIAALVAKLLWAAHHGPGPGWPS